MVTIQLPYLHAMAKRGNLTEVMRMLKLHPFLVNAEEENSDWTPLMLAAREGRFPIVLFLLKSDADPNQRDRERWTALHWACACGQLACATLLLQHGADPSLTSSIGQTPLLLAAMNGHAALVHLLLRTGRAGVDKATRSLETPLWWACYEGHTACARALLLARADPDVRDKRGRSATDMAKEEGYGKCVELFTEWERSYFLYKVWCISDAKLTVSARAVRGCRLPTMNRRLESAPSCLRERLQKGTGLPRVETPVDAPRKRRKSAGEAREAGLVESVVRTVLVEMKRDLFLELLEVMGRTCG